MDDPKDKLPNIPAPPPPTPAVATGATPGQAASPAQPDQGALPVAAPPALGKELAIAQAKSSGFPPGLVIVLAVCAFATGGVLGYAVSSLGGEETEAVASAAPSASVAPSAEPPPPSLVERAASGDFSAIDELAKKPASERTAKETAAIQRGRGENKPLALEAFGEKLAEDPSLLEDDEQLKRVRENFEDQQTMAQMGEILASLGKPRGLDLLYDLWIGTKGTNETTEFARELLYSKDVRSNASPALAVALDLRAAESCEDFKAVLPRAAEHGDRRSLRLVARLMKETGCGENKRDDCYECLRPEKGDKEALKVIDVVRKVRGRRSPKIPD